MFYIIIICSFQHYTYKLITKQFLLQKCQSRRDGLEQQQQQHLASSTLCVVDDKEIFCSMKSSADLFTMLLQCTLLDYYFVTQSTSRSKSNQLYVSYSIRLHVIRDFLSLLYYYYYQLTLVASQISLFCLIENIPFKICMNAQDVKLSSCEAVKDNNNNGEKGKTA